MQLNSGNKGRMAGWMDGLYVLFNSISVISGRRKGGNERLCAMEPCLRLKRFLPLGVELGTARSGPEVIKLVHAQLS